MRILSKIFFWLGMAGVVAAVIIGWQPGWEVYTQYLALSAGRSLECENPLFRLILALAIMFVSGFLMGLGVGMIRRKPKDAKSSKPKGAPNAPATDPLATSEF